MMTGDIKAAAPIHPIRAKCDFTEIGLRFPEALTFDEWAESGDILKAIHGAIDFALGDWLNYGEKQYDGDKYAQALDATDKSYQTLRNVAYTCNRVPYERRNVKLSFSHHVEVAPLEPEMQVEMLLRAEEGKWTVLRLRNEINALRMSQGKKALPGAAFSGSMKTWENHNLITPQLPGDRCIKEVARVIEDLEKNVVQPGHKSVPQEFLQKLISTCEDHCNCDSCEYVEICVNSH
jgi:hypothetical protein